MQQQININQLLQIIGQKEVELLVLKERIQQLENEKKEQKPLTKTELKQDAD